MECLYNDPINTFYLLTSMPICIKCTIKLCHLGLMCRFGANCYNTRLSWAHISAISWAVKDGRLVVTLLQLCEVKEDVVALLLPIRLLKDLSRLEQVPEYEHSNLPAHKPMIELYAIETAIAPSVVLVYSRDAIRTQTREWKQINKARMIITQLLLLILALE